MDAPTGPAPWTPNRSRPHGADPDGPPLHPLIASRQSPRAFDGRPVPPQALHAILEAARWAASSFNEQPWSFLVARRDASEDEGWKALLDALVEGNQAWARQAPVLGVSLARRRFRRNERENRHALHDVGAATALLTLQALHLGLWVHPMAGFDGEAVRRAFHVPGDFEPVAAFALGFRPAPHERPSDLAAQEDAPRERRPLPESVFAGRFGRPHPVVRDAAHDTEER